MKKLREKFIVLKRITRAFNLGLIVFALTLFCSFSVFADGPGEIPSESKKIAVVGDSYTGHFVEDEGIERFEAFIFPVGTICNEKNVEIFNKAIDADNNYILFATGVNDHALSIAPEAFETTLREHVKKIEKKGKYLFVHTYMDYPSRQTGFKHTPNDYDRVLRGIANDSPNVFYIDMSGIDKNKYNTGDGTHYNKFFNDTLKSKLLYLTDLIDANIYNSIVDWIQIAKKNQIAVAGDTSANLFYSYEKNKDFDLLDFTKIDSKLAENDENITKALSSTAMNVILFLGVKDYEDQTDLEEFEETLRRIANENNEYLMADDKYYNNTFYDVLYGIIKDFIEKE